MSITVKSLVNAQYAASSATLYYTVPSGVRAIIDKVTACNTEASTARTISFYLVPYGETQGANHLVGNKADLAAANTTHDLAELKGHVLHAGDMIYAVASAASKVVIKVSGREVS